MQSSCMETPIPLHGYCRTYIKITYPTWKPIPEIDNEYSKKRAIDELPQSGQGKTIMTTEPKFIPQEAAKISLEDGTDIRLRMVDCVGFTVSDAYGYSEGDEERMVKTPWFYINLRLFA